MSFSKRASLFSNNLKLFFKSDSPATSIFLFLFKTTLFYFILNSFFLAYTGLTTPGGKLYIPFLVEYADFISAFRQFLLWGGAQFASSIGYQSGYNDTFLYVKGGSSVRMVYSCLGFSLMSAYAALVLAWPAKALFRIMSLVIGPMIIIALNMIRLGGLAVLYTTRHDGFSKYIDHHDLFNIVVLIAVFLMFTLHIKYSERNDFNKVKGEPNTK